MGPEYLVSATWGDPAGDVRLRMIPMGLGIRSNCKGPKADHRGGGDDCKGNIAKPGHREGGGDGNGRGSKDIRKRQPFLELVGWSRRFMERAKSWEQFMGPFEPGVE